MKSLLPAIIINLCMALNAQPDTLSKMGLLSKTVSSAATANHGLIPLSEPEAVLPYTTPFNTLNTYNNWAIKAKVLPWMGFIASGINYSAGLEFGFLKNHSLGFDLYINNYSFDPPDVYDSTTNSYNGGYRRMLRDRALLLHYRYYLPFQKLREKEGVTLYAGSFLRYGKMHFEYDDGYTQSRETVGETHYSAGLMFGVLTELYYFKRLQAPLNIDAYFGIFIKQKDLKKEYYNFNQDLITDYDHPINGGIRIGLTISMALKYKRS